VHENSGLKIIRFDDIEVKKDIGNVLPAIEARIEKTGLTS